MRLWLPGTLGSAAPVLAQEQDNQNKANLKRVEELTADYTVSLFLLHSGDSVACKTGGCGLVCPSRKRYSNKVRLAGVISALPRDLY